MIGRCPRTGPSVHLCWSICQFCLTVEAKGFGKGSGYRGSGPPRANSGVLCPRTCSTVVNLLPLPPPPHKPSIELKHSGIAGQSIGTSCWAFRIRQTTLTRVQGLGASLGWDLSHYRCAALCREGRSPLMLLSLDCHQRGQKSSVNIYSPHPPACENSTT